MMKKIVIILLLFSFVAAPCYALSTLEKLLYTEVHITTYNVNLLVVKIIGEVKYVWQGSPTSGAWVLLSGKMKAYYQALYDKQKAS
jgi:uncharacterized membrane protein